MVKKLFLIGIPDRYRYDTWSERLLDAQISKK